MGQKIQLKVNGEDVKLNDFLQKFFDNTVIGAVKCLRDIPEDLNSVEFKIVKE